MKMNSEADQKIPIYFQLQFFYCGLLNSYRIWFFFNLPGSIFAVLAWSIKASFVHFRPQSTGFCEMPTASIGGILAKQCIAVVASVHSVDGNTAKLKVFWSDDLMKQVYLNLSSESFFSLHEQILLTLFLTL